MSPEEIRSLKDLKQRFIKAGSVAGLAKDLESNRHFISQVLYEQGLITHHKLDTVYSEEEIKRIYEKSNLKGTAKELGVRPSLLTVKLKRLGISRDLSRRVMDNEVKPSEVQNLLNVGYTIDQLAEKYGFDSRTIRNFISRHSLTVGSKRNQYGIFISLEPVLNEETSPIVDFYRNGNGIYRASKEFGYSVRTLTRFLKILGVVRTSVDRKGYSKKSIQVLLSTMKLKDVANHIGVSKDELSYFCSREGIIPGERFSREEVKEAYMEIGSIAGVARHFNTTPDTIALYLNKLGVDTSKNILTKDEVEGKFRRMLRTTKNRFNYSAFEKLTGLNKELLVHYFGSAEQIKKQFNIQEVQRSTQSIFLDYLETILGFSLDREKNLGCQHLATGGFLRFDGSNEDKKLIIEYDDESHYFDRRELWRSSLSERLKRDRYKDNWAKENGYLLIRFPYYLSWDKKTLKNHLRKNGYKI